MKSARLIRQLIKGPQAPAAKLKLDEGVRDWLSWSRLV
ncbi:hypothetical protein PsAD13_00289 [Pseudovibrio sp. Ad13]|nr:hypothetical protein PsAD13_00289 [Pseudovibrio sp. Ad13]KZK95896.1 hypothetical protein PsAD46_00248 [Pseudovibrio sp. Ad46]KZL00781.1 hypothetical protein PsAD5_00963 [Pseudovibrio sp. Ad5]